MGWVNVDPALVSSASQAFDARASADRVKLVARNGSGECAILLQGGVRSAHVAEIDGTWWVACGNLRLQGEALSGAEVLARLHELCCAGADLPYPKLQGQFLLIKVDPRSGSASLVSDRFGTTPISYRCLESGGFIFTTSMTLTRRWLPALDFCVEPQALYDYIYHQIIPGPRSIYREFRKLECGHRAEYRNGKVSTARHWMPRFGAEPDPDQRALAAQLKGLLARAVERCDREQRAACFLSGGIDSSTVCGLVRARRGAPITAYTIGFDAPGYDELKYARISARHFGLDLREHYLNAAEVAAAVDVIGSSYDEPFGNASAVAVWRLAQLAHADGHRLLLAGDAGDELFGGNERYAKQSLFSLYDRLPRSLRAHVIEPLLLKNSAARVWPIRKLASFVAQARIGMPHRLETYNFLEMTPPESIFTAPFLEDVDCGEPREHLQTVYDAAPDAALVNRMLFLDWKLTLADNDLRKVTVMCEAGGVDVAFPFLDDDLVDFSLRLPADFKVKRLQLRHFYKRAMRDFLPAATIAKTKHGFSLPFGLWLHQGGVLEELTRAHLASLSRRDIFRSEFIKALLEQHRAVSASHYGKLIWLMLVLENWLQRNDGGH